MSGTYNLPESSPDILYSDRCNAIPIVRSAPGLSSHLSLSAYWLQKCLSAKCGYDKIRCCVVRRLVECWILVALFRCSHSQKEKVSH